MNPHRSPGPLARLPRRTPSWRIAWAWCRGILRAAAARDERHRFDRAHGEHVHGCPRRYSRQRWLGSVCICNGLVERDLYLRGIPLPPPKGPGPRPVNIPE